MINILKIYNDTTKVISRIVIQIYQENFITKYDNMPTSFFINGIEFKAINYYISDLTAIYSEKYISNIYGIGVHSVLTVGTKEYCDDQIINSINSSYMYKYTFT